MLITICCHCRRIKAPGTETWLDLFLRTDHSLGDIITHGVCKECIMTNPEYEKIRARWEARRQEALVH